MNRSSQSYSPFWALIAVFLTFIFLQGTNLRSILQQRENLRATQAELEKVIPQALTISQTVENLGRDLLSMTNQEAQQIVTEFKIAPRSPQ